MNTIDRSIERVERALAALAAGEMIIVEDDEDRENEGDLVMPAQSVTPAAVNFMATYGRGLICQAITAERARELDLGPMVARNTSTHETAFTVSVDGLAGVTTGISAADRAQTIKLVGNEATDPAELRRPGHVFPITAKPGGVLERRGHTEATVDLARLAGFAPSGALCEIAREDGSMARHDDLVELAQRHGLVLISIADLVVYREERDRVTVQRAGEAKLPTAHGQFQVIAYRNPKDPFREPVALVAPGWDSVPLVRVHSECLTGEAFGSSRCDCAAQLRFGMQQIAREGGVLVYLRQEGRGIGLANKIRAYALQDGGLDTVDANERLGCGVDERDYRVAAEILMDLGIRSVRLLTNNPDKIEALAASGIDVTERLPAHVPLTPESLGYVRTKAERLGHLYEELELEEQHAANH